MTTKRLCQNPKCGGPIGCRPKAKYCSTDCNAAAQRQREREARAAAYLAWATYLDQVRADAARLRPNRPTGRIAA